MAPSTTSKVTTDHQEVRRWAEERGGKPAAVVRSESGEDPGLIRLDFPGYSGAGLLKQISWDEWFNKFDQRKLALLYQEETAGGEKSNFNKIISRNTAEQVNGALGGRGRSASRSTTGEKTKSASASRSRAGARRSTRAGARTETAKRSPSARGHADGGSRGSTRSRSSGEPASRGGGASRGSAARTSRTTTRGGSRT